MKRIAPFTIALRSSRRLLLIQVLAHFGAMAAVFIATIPAWLAALSLATLLLSLAHLRRAPAILALNVQGDGRLEKVGADGTAVEIVLHPHTRVLPFLVVLLFKQAPSRRLQSLTLLADSLDAEDFRQLRLWLRWRAETLSPGGVGAIPSPAREAASRESPG